MRYIKDNPKKTTWVLNYTRHYDDRIENVTAHPSRYHIDPDQTIPVERKVNMPNIVVHGTFRLVNYTNRGFILEDVDSGHKYPMRIKAAYKLFDRVLSSQVKLENKTITGLFTFSFETSAIHLVPYDEK